MATYFSFCQNWCCQTTFPIDSGLGLKLLINPFIPPINHMVEVLFSTSEVVEDVFVQHEFKPCHGILFQS